MVQFIRDNQLVDTMNAGEDRNTQMALKQMQVQNALAQDRLARGIASIYAEPAPVAPAPVATTQPDYSLQQATPSVGFRPTGSISGLQQGSALSGFKAPELAQNLPDQTVLTPQAVPADTRARRALQLAANTPGGGEMAMQLTQHQQASQSAQQKDRDTKNDNVLKLLADGDIGGAQRYAQFHNLTEVLPIFSNPRALATTMGIGRAAHKELGLDGRDASLFAEAAFKSLNEGKSQQEAMADAYASIRNAPAQITRTVVDDNGNVTGITKYGTAVPIEGARGKSATARSGGAGGSQTGARFGSDASGNTVVTYRDGTSKYVTDPLGNKVPATDKNIAALTASLVKSDVNQYNTPDVEARRNLARQVYGAPTTAPQSSSGVVRQFVPGQGFITK